MNSGNSLQEYVRKNEHLSRWRRYVQVDTFKVGRLSERRDAIAKKTARVVLSGCARRSDSTRPW